jgi:hypothetical protein
MSSNRRASIDERQPLLNGNIAANVTSETVVPEDIPSNVVGWDSSEDPENPRNWTTGSKRSIITILTAITILS